MSKETAATKSMFQSLAGNGKTAGTTNAMAALQSEVMREADEYVGGVAQATDNFRAKVGTTEARDAAQQWKLNQATVAYVNAAGENPIVNAVGMVVLASLSRMVAEDYWVNEKYGEPARPLLQTQRQLESNAWSIVRGVLTTEQQQDLRELILESRKKHPHLRYVSAIRLPELVSTLGKVPEEEQRKKPGSLFSLLYINPLAGLDPTTQAIQQTRMLAQRAMYYAQRAPMLLSWQVELTIYQLAAQPEARQLLSDADEVAKSTTIFARTAEGLPQLVNQQREAAINQLFAGLAAERTNIIAALTSQESQLRTLLPQVRETLTAGAGMADSLNSAVKSLDAFVHYVSPPDTNQTVVSTNSQPFNVLDYGKAAGDIAVAAKELNTLLVSVNQTMPEIARLSQRASGDAKAVVNHAFRLGLVLIVILLIGSVLARFCHQYLARKFSLDRPGRPPDSDKR